MLVIFLVTTDTGGGGFDLLVHARGVARITIEPFVSAIEFETSARVVIEVPDLPVSDAVAVLALRAQPEPVHIVLLVAGVAGRGRLVLIQPSRVAALARGGSMFPPQRIRRIVIVLKEEHVPIPFRVTGFTPLGKFPLMLVVLLMAGEAIDRRLVFVKMPRMTRLALCGSMLSPQRIRRIVVVLEEEYVPIPFCVTGFTLFSKLSLMLVVFLVAGVAVGRSLLLIQVPLMAGLAFGCDMPPP